VGVGTAVGAGVAVRTGVGVGVAVGRAVGTGVLVAAGVLVGVGLGPAVMVAAGVEVPGLADGRRVAPGGSGSSPMIIHEGERLLRPWEA